MLQEIVLPCVDRWTPSLTNRCFWEALIWVYFTGTPLIFKTKVAMELLIRFRDLSASELESVYRQYNLGRMCDHIIHVFGIILTISAMVNLINICNRLSGVSGEPISLPPQWTTKYLGGLFVDSKLTKVWWRSLKRIPKIPFHTTWKFFTEYANSKPDLLAYCSALFTIDDPTIQTVPVKPTIYMELD